MHHAVSTLVAATAALLAEGLPASVQSLQVKTDDDTSAAVAKPNIVFVLTDDEDTVLGGDGPGAMPAGLPALTARGATLENWFVHTPVCACSRSEILTGKFFHNLVDRNVDREDPWDRQGNTNGPCFPGRPAGRGCGPPSSAPGRNMHMNFSLLSPGPTFAQHLAKVGYSVAIFGKYLNRNPLHPSGQPQIPTGVSTWFVSPGDEANKSSALDPSGEYFPSFYYDQAGVWENSELEYETAFLGNRSLSWMREAAAAKSPFFIYLAPHSPHGMSLSAPWYRDLPINETVPVTPSYNYSGADHHWLIAHQQPLTVPEAKTLDRHFQDRWRCLRATDDLLTTLTDELRTLAIEDRTYVFFTADHVSRSTPHRQLAFLQLLRLTDASDCAFEGLPLRSAAPRRWEVERVRHGFAGADANFWAWNRAGVDFGFGWLSCGPCTYLARARRARHSSRHGWTLFGAWVG
jgi:N-acetylglucosamine-6-sulfatase